MNREPQRKGFTIIEVALVLAVSGLILIGVISGVSGSVARQRYNDSVQSIAERLRVVYNQANNPQSDAGGTSLTSAIYGKLVLIDSGEQGVRIDSYTIIGSVDANKASQTAAAKDKLKDANPSIVQDSLDSYTAPWEAQLEKSTDETNNSQPAQGALLIIHSPNGGSVHTYYTNTHHTLNDFATSANFVDILNESTTANTQDINFCVNSPDVYSAGGARRNIRISHDGRNSSAVQLIDLDQGDSKC